MCIGDNLNFHGKFIFPGWTWKPTTLPGTLGTPVLSPLMTAFVNNYTHRKVAEANARGCEICYKPSTSVLVTPENKDFFYVCPGHLKDRGFCTPIIDEAGIVARKKKEMDEEIERVKKEFEEKQKRKKEAEKKKDKDKDKDDDKDKKDDKKKTDDSSGPSTPTPEEEPRVFALHKNFFQLRIDKKRQAEIARRNRERLQNPGLFPEVPKDFPS